MNTIEKLIGKKELLEKLFTESSRPSIRWLDYQIAAKRIPFVKMGCKIFFDLEQVRIAIQNRSAST